MSESILDDPKTSIATLPNIVQFVNPLVHQFLSSQHSIVHSGRVILMKHQSPNLNALPDGDILPVSIRIHKRRMRHPPRPPIRLGIEALDQQHLLGRQATLIIPPVRIIMPHLQRLAPARLRLTVDEARGDEVRVGHRVRVGDGEGVPLDRRDGPPHVDDLHPALEQLVRLVREVVRDPRERGFVGLVYVHALDWAAAGGLGVGVGGRLAADGMVEYEDPGCAGSVVGIFINWDTNTGVCV